MGFVIHVKYYPMKTIQNVYSQRWRKIIMCYIIFLFKFTGKIHKIYRCSMKFCSNIQFYFSFHPIRFERKYYSNYSKRDHISINLVKSYNTSTKLIEMLHRRESSLYGSRMFIHTTHLLLCITHASKYTTNTKRFSHAMKALAQYLGLIHHRWKWINCYIPCNM